MWACLLYCTCFTSNWPCGACWLPRRIPPHRYDIVRPGPSPLDTCRSHQHQVYAAAIVALGIALLAGAHWCAAARAKLCHARYAAASTFLRLPPSNRFRGVLHSGWVLCPSFAVVRQQHHGVLGIGPPAYGLMAVRFFCLPPNRFPPRQNGYAAQPALSTPDAGVSGDNAMVSVNDEDC